MSFQPGPDDRYFLTSFLSILELFKDYHNDIPANARLISVHLSKAERGKLYMVLESPDWKPEDTKTPLEIRFDLQRFFSVGGSPSA